METEILSKLSRLTEVVRRANIKLQQEKEKIKSVTVDTREYCFIVGISRSTVANRRDNGEIPFVMIGDEYRYFLPKTIKKDDMEGMQHG